MFSTSPTATDMMGPPRQPVYPESLPFVLTYWPEIHQVE